MSFILTLLAVACGGTNAELRRAKSALYQTDRQVVWSAITAVLAERYPNLTHTFTPSGDLVAQYWWIDENKPLTPERLYSTDPPVGDFIRLQFFVTQTPPFQIVVSAEGSRYEPRLVTPHVYDRESSVKSLRQEPRWLRVRINQLVLDIYHRLKPHAVEVSKP